MSDQIQKKQNVFGAVIYLKDGNLLQGAALVSDFNRRWGVPFLVGEGQKEDCVYFRSGDFHFAIEFRSVPVPQRVRDSILNHTPDRRFCEELLAKHKAHFGLSASLDSGRLLDLACVFTKLIVSVLRVAPALAVCWLHGPVLCSAQEFLDVAEGMLSIGSPPLMLWINVEWKPEKLVIHSKGMSQFQAPEILLSGQYESSREIVEYLFEAAHYVLTAGKDILDGETIDGPKGVFRISYVKGREPGKRALILIPVRPN